jgi:hypothetical protein
MLGNFMAMVRRRLREMTYVMAAHAASLASAVAAATMRS